MYSELEYQRQHLLEQKTPEDRAMVMAGINRLLDELLDKPEIIMHFEPSAEGQAHLDSRLNRGCE